MAIFVVGDLHLSLGGDKPMDVFEGWEGYLPKLEANWRTLISPQDTVILAGDTRRSPLPAATMCETFSEVYWRGIPAGP